MWFKKSDPEVLVVGAGPVGMVSALELARAGVRVEIVDEQWRTAGHSYALALHPRSVDLLVQRGLEDLADRGHRIDTVAFYDGGDRRAELDLSLLAGDHPELLVVPQRALEDLLENRLRREKVKVRWNHRLSVLDATTARPEVRIERLGKDTTGYGISSTVWVVEKIFRMEPFLVLGADGHRSSVRRRAGIDFPEVGEAQVFGVFEFLADGPIPDEMSVVLDDETTNVLWPLGDGRYRWSFELSEEELFAQARTKSRLQVQLGTSSLPYVPVEKLGEILAERVPWFQAEIDEVIWSAAVRFERRLAGSFGRGAAWLAGDAAHLANPVGVQSMNVGLAEGVDLADRFSRILRDDASLDILEEYEDRRLREWEHLLHPEESLRIRDEADEWVRRRASRIPVCVPATGEDLKALLDQIGLELEPASETSREPAAEA
ncbi:MAG: FAD-dependent monooxygenase [Thermoanaerobaculia bacterium]|nr:FAD-dependent monooxygenase [Thermoanaerobaculia bacterium]